MVLNLESNPCALDVSLVWSPPVHAHFNGVHTKKKQKNVRNLPHAGKSPLYADSVLNSALPFKLLLG